MSRHFPVLRAAALSQEDITGRLGCPQDRKEEERGEREVEERGRWRRETLSAALIGLAVLMAHS